MRLTVSWNARQGLFRRQRPAVLPAAHAGRGANGEEAAAIPHTEGAFYVTKTVHLPSLGESLKLKLSGRALHDVETVGIERYLLGSDATALGPTGRRLQTQLVAHKAALANELHSSAGVPPSATLIWHYLQRIKRHDESVGGFCLQCLTPGHTAESCQTGPLEGDVAFYDSNASSTACTDGTPVCFEYHLYSLCLQGECEPGRCVACGDRHPTCEHFAGRSHRPVLPRALPAWPLPERALWRHRRDASLDEIVHQETARARRTDLDQLFLRRYQRRISEEAAAHDAWSSHGSPALDAFTPSYPTLSRQEAVAAVRRAIPRSVVRETAVLQATRRRIERQMARDRGGASTVHV